MFRQNGKVAEMKEKAYSGLAWCRLGDMRMRFSRIATNLEWICCTKAKALSTLVEAAEGQQRESAATSANCSAHAFPMMFKSEI